MFNIKSEKELLTFLKIVSQEAVKESKRSLNENDPFVSNFKSRLESDGLLEQEDEEESEEKETKKGSGKEAEEEEKSKDKEAEEEEKSDTNPAREKALSLGGYDDAEGGPSFESVMTAINTMRAGRSLKDKEIKTELNDYYDRLDENERSVLLLFLKELSKILTGALEGEDAQDPSDPSTYFNITKRDPDEEVPGSEKNVIRKGGEEIEAQKKDPNAEPQQQQSDEEDTSPPIKVKESQDIRWIRQKVRQLMRS